MSYTQRIIAGIVMAVLLLIGHVVLKLGWVSIVLPLIAAGLLLLPDKRKPSK